MSDIFKNICIGVNKPKDKPPMQSMVLDSGVMDSTNASSAFEMGALKLDVAAVIQQFAETDEEELEAGETLCDRLLSLFCGLVDGDKNGDIDKEEAEVLGIAYNIAADYLLRKGIDEADILAFLEEDDEDAATNIQEYLRNTLPDGEEAESNDSEEFAFGDGSEEAAYDAAYKKVKAIRNGQKVIIRKRIAGRVRLTSKQKLALVKARRKAHSGRARIKRLKSMKKRQKLGL